MRALAGGATCSTRCRRCFARHSTVHSRHLAAATARPCVMDTRTPGHRHDRVDRGRSAQVDAPTMRHRTAAAGGTGSAGSGRSLGACGTTQFDWLEMTTPGRGRRAVPSWLSRWDATSGFSGVSRTTTHPRSTAGCTRGIECWSTSGLVLQVGKGLQADEVTKNPPIDTGTFSTQPPKNEKVRVVPTK